MSAKTALLIGLLLAVARPIAQLERAIINLSMPDARPGQNHSTLCTGQSLNPATEQYIVGFQPDPSTSKQLQSLTIYACARLDREPANLQFVWDCSARVCRAGTKPELVYFWEGSALGFNLPSRLGFKLGKNSALKHLVLEARYRSARRKLAADDSGFILQVVSGAAREIMKQAAILKVSSYGHVVKAHTRALGFRVGLIKLPLTNPKSSQLIAEYDPRKPKIFHRIKQAKLSPGDELILYCDYNNTRGRPIKLGSSPENEVCAAHLMYWADGGKLLAKNSCNGLSYA